MPLALSIDRGLSSEIPNFWDRCGPTLLDPATSAELGATPRDLADRMIWWVASANRSGTLLGFCAAEISANKVELRSDFVVPRYRRCGVYRQLSAKRDAWLAEQFPSYRHEITSRHLWQIRHYEQLGFTRSSQRGAFTVLRREAQESLSF